jgi:hypothetical protein
VYLHSVPENLCGFVHKGIRDANDSVNDLCPNRLNTYFAGNAVQTSVRPAVGSN